MRPWASHISPTVTGSTPGPVLRDEASLRRAFDASFPSLVADAQRELDTAAALAPRVVEGAFVRAWTQRETILGDIHLPLLWPGITTAALLVFVEVMKELPATALLRPLGGDTLAIAVWEATKDSRFDTAALPALLIVAASLVPVVIMIRLSRGIGEGPTTRTK